MRVVGLGGGIVYLVQMDEYGLPTTWGGTRYREVGFLLCCLGIVGCGGDSTPVASPPPNKPPVATPPIGTALGLGTCRMVRLCL